MPTLKLRQDTVRTLAFTGATNKQQCIYWDTTLECFGLRVFPSGRRIYVCSYRIARRKRMATLGRADVLTLDQARKKAMTYLGQAANQKDPQSELDLLYTQKTMAQVCEAFVENHLKTKRIDWKGGQSILKRRILPKLGSRLAQSITSADLEPIHAEVGARHPYAANDMLELVRKMFNWAKVAGHVPKLLDNPTRGIVWFRARKRKRFITTVEMPLFISAIEQEANDYARHGLWMLLLTGLRSKELLKAKWADVDWDVGTLFIGLTKNGEPLLAPLSDAAIARLCQIPRIAGNPHIICGQKLGSYLTGLGEALRRARIRANLVDIRVHDLRRTVGSWLAQDGRSLHLIGDVLNHKDPKTTAGYAYFQTQQRREALTSHGDKVLALGGAHLRPPPVLECSTSLLTTATPEKLKELPANEGPHPYYFEREALYELVWTAPVFEVAYRLGVSDVAVAKLCRRAGVPIPPRGHWARIESGQQIARPRLPPAPEGLPALLRIRGRTPAFSIPRSLPSEP